MEFEILTAGMVVFPSFVVYNEWGPICWSTDVDTPWHGRPRPVGHYRTAAWFPGNFVSAGMLTVTAAACIPFSPHTAHLPRAGRRAFSGSRNGWRLPEAISRVTSMEESDPEAALGCRAHTLA